MLNSSKRFFFRTTHKLLSIILLICGSFSKVLCQISDLKKSKTIILCFSFVNFSFEFVALRMWINSKIFWCPYLVSIENPLNSMRYRRNHFKFHHGNLCNHWSGNLWVILLWKSVIISIWIFSLCTVFLLGFFLWGNTNSKNWCRKWSSFVFLSWREHHYWTSTNARHNNCYLKSGNQYDNESIHHRAIFSWSWNWTINDHHRNTNSPIQWNQRN